MSVVIEELDAEVTPSPTPPAAPPREAAPAEPDERRILEALAQQAWLHGRLHAD